MNVFFEMGSIDPKNNYFDHHGVIEHSNNFLAKMASVQLLEKLIMTGTETFFDINEVELNHVGHLDDMVLFAISPAIKEGKIRNLYAKACIFSSLDSCGPLAYKLLNDTDQNLVKEVYQCFQDEIDEISKNLGIPRFKLTMDQKIPAAKKAGEFLVSKIEKDQYSAPEVWRPNPEHFDVIRKEKGMIMVNITNPQMNPLRASGYFYETGSQVVIAYSFFEDTCRFSYTISVRSVYEKDLSPVWGELNKLEPKENPTLWGGHSGAGGSPRKQDDFEGGSVIPPYKVWEIVEQFT